jgi:hypothetical protein
VILNFLEKLDTRIQFWVFVFKNVKIGPFER